MALLRSALVWVGFGRQRKSQLFDAAALKPTRMLPISYLLHQDDTPVDVYWTQ